MLKINGEDGKYTMSIVCPVCRDERAHIIGTSTKTRKKSDILATVLFGFSCGCEIYFSFEDTGKIGVVVETKEECPNTDLDFDEHDMVPQ